MRRLNTSKSQLATHGQGVTRKPLGDNRQSIAFVPDFGPRARLRVRLSSLIVGPRLTFACHTISLILLPYLSPLVTLSFTDPHTGTLLIHFHFFLARAHPHVLNATCLRVRALTYAHTRFTFLSSFVFPPATCFT